MDPNTRPSTHTPNVAYSHPPCGRAGWPPPLSGTQASDFWPWAPISWLPSRDSRVAKDVALHLGRQASNLPWPLASQTGKSVANEKHHFPPASRKMTLGKQGTSGVLAAHLHGPLVRRGPQRQMLPPMLVIWMAFGTPSVAARSPTGPPQRDGCDTLFTDRISPAFDFLILRQLRDTSFSDVIGHLARSRQRAPGVIFPARSM